MNISIIGISLMLLLTGVASGQEVEWPSHGNDPGGTKYSSLDQINRSNVSRLKRVWTWDSYYDVIPARESSLTLASTNKNPWGDPLPKIRFVDSELSLAGITS